MLVPAGDGSWPAFWLLPTNSLITAQKHMAEIDAVEMYGHDPLSSCHSVHQYNAGEDRPDIHCGRRFATAREALGWHVYGVQVTPTVIRFSIDGKQVEQVPQAVGGDQPMFFMSDLTVGGGWPVALDAVRNRVALYVDYIRVYV
jgi:beta-glucanase (GH16 family)